MYNENTLVQTTTAEYSHQVLASVSGISDFAIADLFVMSRKLIHLIDGETSTSAFSPAFFENAGENDGENVGGNFK